ncbi:hypothetical protein [Comamonas terrigena]|uniref:hypothetical protein n=1 Tax=Comamonas terrigena TaxID=32013 RepID=UPI00244955F8|nr:hypothetical protein [Comamonas terrigena]MDH0048121.1 hypothetical protein [Comamonas terrigena]MDH0510280.1 hypothetical protein [Comamonas terrigena]MDH1089881.1 hypothetical protein [Comamonas terrigena]MDH1293123.1 hypothetical protein [Comamonas terrigena]MDH1499753.1 hypothetical protein [Comamonas terrigena]
MTAPEQRIIYLQPAAPPKPAMGAACNGCGLCCLAEPCPLGIWVSRRRTGACKALQWDEAGQHYRCGMVSDPGAVLGWQQPWAVRLVARLARRWIAAGAGCDADWEAQKAQEAQEAPPRR